MSALFVVAAVLNAAVAGIGLGMGQNVTVPIVLALCAALAASWKGWDQTPRP